MTKISEKLREETVSMLSNIHTNVLINVWKDGSGGYFSYVHSPNDAIALTQITHDIHERKVMNKEYHSLMRKRHKVRGFFHEND